MYLGVVVEENKKKSVFAIFSPDLKSAALTLRLWNCVSSKVELLNFDINNFGNDTILMLAFSLSPSYAILFYLMSLSVGSIEVKIEELSAVSS